MRRDDNEYIWISWLTVWNKLQDRKSTDEDISSKFKYKQKIKYIWSKIWVNMFELFLIFKFKSLSILEMAQPNIEFSV
jgi:hypothetical protein